MIDGLILCCLMTPGFSKDIQCHVQIYFFCKLANQQIRSQSTLNVAVSLAISHAVTSMFLRGLCGYIWLAQMCVAFYHTNGDMIT